MKALVNQVQLIGHLGADAEIRTTNQGTKVSTLNLATNQRVKMVNGEWKENTQWHSCVVWGEMNKIVEKYGKKGNQLMVLGELTYRDYTDSAGAKRQVAEVRVTDILVLKSSGSNRVMAQESPEAYS